MSAPPPYNPNMQHYPPQPQPNYGFGGGYPSQPYPQQPPPMGGHGGYHQPQQQPQVVYVERERVRQRGSDNCCLWALLACCCGCCLAECCD